MTKLEKLDESKEDYYAYYDSDEFSEIVLKHMLQSPAVLAAVLARKVVPDDFVSGVKGMKVYKDFATIILELKQAPCDIAVFNMHLRVAKEKGKFKNYEEGTIDELTAYLFDTTSVLQVDYVIEHLPLFVRRRRMLKASQSNPDDLEAQHAEFAKIHDDCQAVEVNERSRSLTPFETIVKVPTFAGMTTGIGVLDAKTGGLRRGECGLIVGHSGSGKTAVASYMMRQSALAGFNVLYISAEEPAENICNRWYSQQFRINYTRLYQGDAGFELEDAFNNCSMATREKLKKLRISDVRGLAPLNARAVRDVIERYADEGFVPDVVMFDQMDYLKPVKNMAKGTGKWQEYEAVSFEIDLLSQHRIGGIHEFGLWVVHQAAGEMQWTYGYEGIAGFKGIVKPFDIAIGIGRESREEKHINLFSMKMRHSEHFKAPMLASFEYMTFEDDATYKPRAEREKEARKANSAKGKITKKSTPVKSAEEVEAEV